MNIQSENTVHKIILEKSINNIKNVYRKFSFIQENYNSYQFKYNFFFFEINQKKIYTTRAHTMLIFIQTQLYTK